MDDLEQQLKNALARKEPSPYFEARVLNAAKRQVKESRAVWRLRWLSAAVASVLIVTGVVWQRDREVREKAAGEAAKAKLELALKVTSVHLQRIQQKVNSIE